MGAGLTAAERKMEALREERESGPTERSSSVKIGSFASAKEVAKRVRIARRRGDVSVEEFLRGKKKA